MKRIAWCAAAIALASAAGSAKCADADLQAAAQYPISGDLRADYFRGSKFLDGSADSVGATVQVKALPVLSEGIESKLEVRATDPRVGDDTKSKGEILEGYVTVHFDRADLRVGKQIVAWGRADGINPTDNLTPRDFTVMLPFEDDQRMGTTAAKLDYFLSEADTLTLFATPFFAASTIPLPPSAHLVYIVDKSPANMSNTEAAIRLNHVGDGLDWSLSALRGFNQLPQLRVAASNYTSATIHLCYPHITIFGADFAKNFGRFGVRGELAYGRPDGSGNDAAGDKKPYLFWVAGVDRTFFDNLNVNLQYFQRRVSGHPNADAIASPFARAIAIESDVINGQRDRVSNGMTFRVSDKWLNDTLEFEIFSVINFTRRDRFIRPLLTYAFTDRWKGSVGAEIYTGAADTQFGALKGAKGLVAELRYGF